MTGRIKDFEILPLSPQRCVIVTACSDGTVRFWALSMADLDSKSAETANEAAAQKGFSAPQVGTLLGSYSTGTRITCMKAFPMTGKPDHDDEDELVLDKEAGSGEEESSDEESE